MSQENFVEYYTNWIRQPEQQDAAAKLDAITNEGEFGKFALSQAKESGLDFNEQDIIDVMEASVSKARNDADIKIEDLAQADELAQEEMGATAGGYKYSAFTRSSRSLVSYPTVSIYGSSKRNILESPKLGRANYSTIMCCW